MSHSAIGHAPEEKYHHGKSPAAYAFSIIFMVAVVVGVVAMVPTPNLVLLAVAGVIALAAWITWAVLRGMGLDNV
ncbi:hypothetical protein [Raineyella sp.]|uniref:Uncharacterized protein n=1 Tax=bioreactor metagenome TaxID=1076179 RepID=A0A645BET0_9ZZZZ|nr:hypothetical protein [Raineyella sp.]MEA5153591.1 hypothetical protein [Raineyella sp.]